MDSELMTKIEALLARGEREKAREVLREALTAPLTEEERGALLVGFAAAYLAFSSAANEAYRDDLHETVAALEEITRLERRADEELRLTRVRRKLGG